MPAVSITGHDIMQAAFTAKELREVLNMEGISVMMPEEDMVISKADEAELKLSRSRKRVVDLLLKASQNTVQRCIWISHIITNWKEVFILVFSASCVGLVPWTIATWVTNRSRRAHAALHLACIRSTARQLRCTCM